MHERYASIFQGHTVTSRLMKPSNQHCQADPTMQVGHQRAASRLLSSPEMDDAAFKLFLVKFVLHATEVQLPKVGHSPQAVEFEVIQQTTSAAMHPQTMQLLFHGRKQNGQGLHHAGLHHGMPPRFCAYRARLCLLHMHYYVTSSCLHNRRHVLRSNYRHFKLKSCQRSSVH